MGDHAEHPLKADGGNGYICLAPDERVADIEREHVSFEHIALLVLLQEFPNGFPAANVRPVEAHWNDQHLVRSFHHCIIDGDVGRSGESIRVGTHEQTVGRRSVHRHFDLLGDARLMKLKLLHIGTRRGTGRSRCSNNSCHLQRTARPAPRLVSRRSVQRGAPPRPRHLPQRGCSHSRCEAASAGFQR